jgi:hypothetical protein
MHSYSIVQFTNEAGKSFSKTSKNFTKKEAEDF